MTSLSLLQYTNVTPQLLSRGMALLAFAMALTPANASMVLTITPTTSTVANITASGTFDATPAQRGTRVSLLSTGADSGATSLFSSQGSGNAWTLQTPLPGSSTLQTSNGGVLQLANAFVGTLGGETKVIFSVTVFPGLGTGISGTITGLTLPAGFTWGAVGATGQVRYGQNNAGTSTNATGTWVIAAAPAAVPEPQTTMLMAMGLAVLSYCRRGGPTRR